MIVISTNSLQLVFKVLCLDLRLLLACMHAVCPAEEWHQIISSLGWDSIQLRDARYDQVVHMMTAASGAEQFYQLSNNSARSEGIELARELDTKAAQVHNSLQ